MQLAFILLFIIGLLLLVTALNFPNSFFQHEKKRKLFRKMKREEEKEDLFKS